MSAPTAVEPAAGAAVGRTVAANASNPSPATARFVALVGNPRRGSRTAALAQHVLDVLAAEVATEEPATEEPGSTHRSAVLDLAELVEALGSPFGADAAQRYAAPLATVRTARLLVVATPTYKASYTGLLKSFLDHVPAGGLAGTVAIPVLTTGSPAHTLAAEVHLRPLLVELGAVTPTSALVVTDPDLSDPRSALRAWLPGAAPVLRHLLGSGPTGVRRS